MHAKRRSALQQLFYRSDLCDAVSGFWKGKRLANFVLVHGGRRAGDLWSKIVPLLEKKGHTVVCPSLSNPETSSLNDHISEVCNVILDHDLYDVILVGHSYGGIVITGVADRIPKKLSFLVYLDSAFPEHGKSLFDVINQTGFRATGYYRLEPLKPFVDQLLFDTKIFKRIPKAYIFCKRSEFVEVSGAAYKKVVDHAEDDNWIYFELDANHTPMLTHPQEVADLLLTIAERAQLQNIDYN